MGGPYGFWWLLIRSDERLWPVCCFICSLYGLTAIYGFRLTARDARARRARVQT
jgi:hypothetical protein